MTTTAPVLHRGARAITPHEFVEALRATCPPRFAHARSRTHRPIALAVSGGVDSMALAFLCSKIRSVDHWALVADHPVSTPVGITVNHCLREGSTEEADKVTSAVRQLGLRSAVYKIRWEEVLPRGTNPNDLPNIETLARYHRYRRLGVFCSEGNIAALLTAHHEDDQYETVLMRLLSGHGYRGLQGMRPATDIPECYDLHRVYQSGFADQERKGGGLYAAAPNNAERRILKRELRHQADPAVIAREIEEGVKTEVATAYLEEFSGVGKRAKRIPSIVPLDTEDGGVMVYRPLLQFSKDRLVATCVENNVPWFEDHTNTDQTLTLRNAVRHMHRNYKLPEALQKPAILRLAARCRTRVLTAEDEAERLFENLFIHEFSANAGTVSVTLPQFIFPTVPRRSSTSATARERRVAHYRHIAAIFLRRLITMVTPERELSQPAQLSHLVSMLFPNLCLGSPAPPPKPYVICSVLFTPLPNPTSTSFPPFTHSSAQRWFLARAPHPSNIPRPTTTFNELPFARRVARDPVHWKVKVWTEFRQYDGRFWISLLHRLPCRVQVMPLEPEHLKPFREALTEGHRKDAEQGKGKEGTLMALLGRHAPGKTRFTLPAIYATIDVSRLLRGEGWWDDSWDSTTITTTTTAPNINITDTTPNTTPNTTPETTPNTWITPTPPNSTDNKLETQFLAQYRSRTMSAKHAQRLAWERHIKALAKEDGRLYLLALPTLGIGLPGLDEWLRWQIRYRKVDGELLSVSRMGWRRMGRRGWRGVVLGKRGLSRRAGRLGKGSIRRGR
ncbi:uncharacterized protein C8A04DRAFT_15885 [Dichotomopilus funicola]|uniref:tRNA(Ile)-lysidine synthetase n=1 Tax=Dichotomopilus funicola TaxID=1934379 RepID=A0AAN6UX12_9PEZI|nr:hypothetical protein C8A04DRAFT_15885 [Dichotomopilus funicola]